MQVAGSLACAKRGWVNVDVAKIECEICGAQLDFALPSASSFEGEAIMEMIIVKKECFSVFLALPLCKLVMAIYLVFFLMLGNGDC